MWNFDRSIKFTKSSRRITHEILDEQTPDGAQASLRDLVRINRYLGGHEALRSALRSVVKTAPFTLLDVGAASGDAAEVVRREFPHASVTCLDYRQHHLRKASGQSLVGDAFRLPFAPNSFDIVACSLFLHHFTDAQIAGLLRDFGSLARQAVIVNDLERHLLPFYFLPCTRWLFGWDNVTLHDGPISVQAGFMADELKTLAERAGLRDVKVRVHRPAFRITLTARAV